MADVARKRMRDLWRGMLERCRNPQHVSYRYYGARGVTVCERWLSFENFLADMSPRPDGTTLDRFPNKDGNYEPGNCRWATITEQNNNKSDTRMLTHDGRTQNMTAWAREIGMTKQALRARLEGGWPVDVALTKGRLPDGQSYLPNLRRTRI